MYLTMALTRRSRNIIRALGAACFALTTGGFLAGPSALMHC